MKLNFSKLSYKSSAPPDNSYNKNANGFSLNKFFDKNSVFYGKNSLIVFKDKVDDSLFVIDHLPNKNDNVYTASVKLAVLGWTLLCETFLNQFNLDRFNKIDFGDASDPIYQQLNGLCEASEVVSFSGANLIRMNINNKYIYVHDRFEDVYSHRKPKKFEIYSNGLLKEDIINYIWEKNNNLLIINNESFNQGEHGFPDSLGMSITCKKSNLYEKEIFGSSLLFIKKLEEDFLHFKAKKISRGYLLIGKPGTGKTGIVNHFLSNVKGKVAILGSMHDNLYSFIEPMFLEIKPDFVVFDDCDRYNGDVRSVLRLIDSVKQNNPNTTFIFIANSFAGILEDEAMTRKGRIDQIYEIAPPDEKDRIEIIKNYLKQFNITISEEDFNKCVSLSEDMTGADLRELCLQLERVSIDDYRKIFEHIDSLRDKYVATDQKANRLKY